MKKRDVFKTLRWSVSEKKLMDLTVNYFRKMLHFMFDRVLKTPLEKKGML